MSPAEECLKRLEVMLRSEDLVKEMHIVTYKDGVGTEFPDYRLV